MTKLNDDGVPIDPKEQKLRDLTALVASKIDGVTSAGLPVGSVHDVTEMRTPDGSLVCYRTTGGAIIWPAMAEVES